MVAVRSILVMAGLALGAAVTFAAQGETFRLHAPDAEAPAVARLRADLVWAERRIGRTLGEFPDTVSVHVHPSRDDFSGALPAVWGLEGTECWMVGAAGDGGIHLLAPAAWAEDACEHDPGDADHVRMLIAHEAVHAFHGQSNPSPDLGRLEDIGWFIEGLATYVSGQLESEHADRAAAAVARGAGPVRLADALAGPYRYGVAGSMVAFIDREWGRETLRGLLTATSQDEILGALDMTESRFLERWREWVLRAPA
jgi:hypothetical protein